LDEIIEKLPEEFNMTEITGKVEERTPYVIVAFQECERMNFLTSGIKRSLRELDLGLKGELTITSDMEDLENALFFDQVPPVWASRAYPSLSGLTAWFVDLLLRIRELETWSTDFVVRLIDIVACYCCSFARDPRFLLVADPQQVDQQTIISIILSFLLSANKIAKIDV
jgi:hypothetical protein